MTTLKTPKLYFFAFLTWVIPIFVSFFLIDPNTKEYLPNFIGFKLIMFVLLSAVTYMLMKRIFAKSALGKWLTASLFLVVNIVLDLVVLISLLKIEFMSWLLTILPIYVIVFYGMEYLLHKTVKS
jgi:hypothetical protein